MEEYNKEYTNKRIKELNNNIIKNKNKIIQ